MPTFAPQSKTAWPFNTTKSMIPDPHYSGRRHEAGGLLSLHRTRGNQAVQQMLEEKEDSTAGGISRFHHDFSQIPVTPPDRAAENHGSREAIVKHHQLPFSAAIHRAHPASQNDSTSATGREPAMGLGAREMQTPTAPAQRLVEARDGKAVLFPAESLQAAALPGQSDSILSMFRYKSSIEQKGPPPPGGFGITRPFYAWERPGPKAVPTTGGFNVTGTIEAQISFQVAGHNRTDIASEYDPDITQQNYSTVVSDLTPSPNTVNRPGVALYKNQPPRTHFWAEDLTIKHERFHADEDVKFGREGVWLAQDWLNGQTVRSIDEIGPLLNQVAPMIARHVDANMTLPDKELRAYNDGAPDYLARAQAIKRKGDAGDYVPPPSAPSSTAGPKAPYTPHHEPPPK